MVSRTPTTLDVLLPRKRKLGVIRQHLRLVNWFSGQCTRQIALLADEAWSFLGLVVL